MEGLVVREVRRDEQELLFRRRFEVLVAEAGPHQFEGYAKYRSLGRMPDDGDYGWHNIGAFLGGNLVGAASIRLSGKLLHKHRDTYAIDTLKERLEVTILMHETIAEAMRGFVVPEYRGRGIFRRLIDAISDRYRDMGGVVLVAGVKATNTDVLETLERADWFRYAVDGDFALVARDVRRWRF